MNQATTTQPDAALSRTEIAMRVRGLVADLYGMDQTKLRETAQLRNDLSLSKAGVVALFIRLENLFGTQETAPADARAVLELAERGTFGQLIDMIEGAVRAGGTR